MTTKQFISKACIFTIVLCIAMHKVDAQKLVYSEPEKNEARQTSFEIIGKYNDNYLVYKNYRAYNTISVFNRDMKLVKSIELNFMPEKIIEANFVAYPDFAFLFYQYQQKGVIRLMAVKLDTEGKNFTEPIEIDTTITGNNSDVKIYSVLPSEDKNHILVFRINTKNERRFLFKTLLFDKELTLKHSTSKLGLNMAERSDFLTDFSLDNDGNMVFGKGLRQNQNANITKFFLVVKHAAQDTFSFKELVFDKISLDEVKLKLDNTNNRYLFTSFYYPYRKTAIEGVANAIYDKNANDWVIRNTIPLDEQLRDDARGENSLKTAFDDYFINDITIRSDGAFLLNAESNYQTSRGSTNPYNRWDMMNPYMNSMDYYRYGGYGSSSGFGSPYGYGPSSNATRYHADNIMVLAFDKNGKMILSNMVNKTQFDDNSRNAISYQMVNTGNGLQYIFNENEGRNVVLAYQTLNTEGRIIRNPTVKNLIRDYKFLPRFAKQVDRRIVIIPCLYRNALCFAKLEFSQ
jgi:hypothetical protein